MPAAKAQGFSDLVRELAGILDETGLTEIEVERDGQRIRVARQTSLYVGPPPAAAPAASPASAPVVPAAAAPVAPAGDVVTSPMVGAVYLQPQPGAPPFVQAGDSVTAGQTLLLIEAMKTMNPITAPRAGKVLEILVQDAQAVEFGEPLVVIG
jgi:acetyl-CoA carboxylase biotin carboxyl carrier protein